MGVTRGPSLQLANGDVVLFSGSHPMHQLQHERTGCPWGQVGVILDFSDGELYVFESTRVSNCVDVKLRRIVCGVQWVRLSDRILSFEGSIAARSLAPPLTGSMIGQFVSFAREVHGRPFNNSKWVALRSIRRRNPRSSCSCYFCSELVAEAYQRIGLLPKPPDGRTSNNYIPADFSTMYSDRMLPLQHGFRLGVELLLKGTALSAPPRVASATPAEPNR
jgi:hypothetical protein